MRQASFRSRVANSVTAAIAGSAARRLVSTIVLLAGSMLLTAAIGAYHRRPSASGRLTNSSTVLSLGQSSGRSGRDLNSRLSLQPEADRFRRIIGKRFVESGRERSTLVGRLTVGPAQYQVRIVRTQEDDGEQVDVSLNGAPVSLTWNGKDGAKSAGSFAIGIERSLIERLALDSADQFVLAQTRGASYYTAARNVVPEGSGDDYAGPSWDLVRVGEPETSNDRKPQSSWRLYYINTVTHLIDKVLSSEQGELILAEFSDWAKGDSELLAAHLTWRRGDQVLMELVLNNVSHGPK